LFDVMVTSGCTLVGSLFYSWVMPSPLRLGLPLYEESTMKNLFWIAGLALFDQLADAESRAVPYQYGDHLDIAKVVSLEYPFGGCEIVEATMIYLDSAGETHVMSYLRQGADCHDY